MRDHCMLDVLKVALQEAQYRHMLELQRIVDQHICAPVPVPKKKGVFDRLKGKKEVVSIPIPPISYPAPMSRGWEYPPSSSGSNKEHFLHYLEESRRNAYQNVKKSDQLTEVLLYLDELERKVRG